MANLRTLNPIGDLTSGLASSDPADCAQVDSEQGSDTGSSHPSGAHLSNGPHVRFSEIRPHAAFCRHVLHVVQVGSEEEMLDIPADWAVAPVKDVQTLGDGSMDKFPSGAMGEDRLPTSSDHSVAHPIGGVHPIEAAAVLHELGAEPHREGNIRRPHPAQHRERVAVSTPAAIVHRTPATTRRGFGAFLNGACTVGHGIDSFSVGSSCPPSCHRTAGNAHSTGPIPVPVSPRQVIA